MQFAWDYNDKRIHIDDTHSNQQYYCPYCGAPLDTRKGEIRQHHFAHKKNRLCTDSWERTHSYDVSPWHNEWQSQFPTENQEIKLSLGDTTHRADIMIDRTVVEFQHSLLPVKSFDDRNNFYFNLGNKVVWLFDLSDILDDQLFYREINEGLVFYWRNPKKAFNNYDIQNGCIDLFFQLRDGPENCIVRVRDVSEKGFESFTTTKLMNKQDFLSYIGLINGKCLPPQRDDIENNRQYSEFKIKYDVQLNQQQERALLAIEGANLLLAVPGSGKTTVLVNRLGHMVINKNIRPENILAITYNTAAAEEMQERFSSKFGEEISRRIDFRTINSLSLKIYKEFCRKHNRSLRCLIAEKDRRSLITEILQKHRGEYPAENDILELSGAITYIKNMMLRDDDIQEIEQYFPYLLDMYKSYQSSLDSQNKMDFDDQMRFAYWILQHDEAITNRLKSRYQYICVDEAQDTSKIQHQIIRILSNNPGNNIFMVGDEDQSIYGFRAAYPKALLNFRYDYTNPYILRMERNYRSTSQIVDKAQAFISANKGRYEKNMISVRGDGDEVVIEEVPTREAQYTRLLDIAWSANNETAFLYRDNESAVVLVDLLLRNRIPFKLRKPEMNFFGNRVVRDVVAILSLALDEYDTASFEQICNKGLLYLKTQQRDFAIRNSKYKHISIYDALDGQMQYVKQNRKEIAANFRRVMKQIADAKSSDAIECLLHNGYNKYMIENNLDRGKVEVLHILSKQEPDKRKFLERLKYLETVMQQGVDDNTPKALTLSTIHSSKGLEYDRVYMVDVYDGRFPSAKPNIFSRSKDGTDAEQEERRLFYVGMTRAINNLHFFSIEERPSSFLEEIFPEQKIARVSREKEKAAAERERKKAQRGEAKQGHFNQYSYGYGYGYESGYGYNAFRDIGVDVPSIGMMIEHNYYGVLEIVAIEPKEYKTIIHVRHSNGELSSMVWEILLENNMIRPIFSTP